MSYVTSAWLEHRLRPSSRHLVRPDTVLRAEYCFNPIERMNRKWDGQPRDHGRYGFGKKPKRVQLAGDITGFTKHGINQAISRGVSPASLHDAVVNPLQILPQANGTTQYIGRGAVVVLNPLGQVVTTWRR